MKGNKKGGAIKPATTATTILGGVGVPLAKRLQLGYDPHKPNEVAARIDVAKDEDELEEMLRHIEPEVLIKAMQLVAKKDARTMGMKVRTKLAEEVQIRRRGVNGGNRGHNFGQRLVLVPR